MCYPCPLWSMALHWNLVNPPWATTLNEIDSSLLSPKEKMLLCYQLSIGLSYGSDFVPISLLHVGCLSGLSLHRSCTSWLNYYELICAASLLCPENTLSLSSTTSGSNTLFSPLPKWPLNFGRKGYSIVPIKLKHFPVPYSLELDQL